MNREEKIRLCEEYLLNMSGVSIYSQKQKHYEVQKVNLVTETSVFAVVNMRSFRQKLEFYCRFDIKDNAIVYVSCTLMEAYCIDARKIEEVSGLLTRVPVFERNLKHTATH